MLRAQRVRHYSKQSSLPSVLFDSGLHLVKPLWISTKLSMGLGRWLSGREGVQHEGLDFNPQHCKNTTTNNNKNKAITQLSSLVINRLIKEISGTLTKQFIL